MSGVLRCIESNICMEKIPEDKGISIFKDKRKDKKQIEAIEGLYTVIGKFFTERDFLVRVLENSKVFLSEVAFELLCFT